MGIGTLNVLKETFTISSENGSFRSYKKSSIESCSWSSTDKRFHINLNIGVSSVLRIDDVSKEDAALAKDALLSDGVIDFAKVLADRASEESEESEGAQGQAEGAGAQQSEDKPEAKPAIKVTSKPADAPKE